MPVLAFGMYKGNKKMEIDNDILFIAVTYRLKSTVYIKTPLDIDRIIW